jgi:hypothetical protein
MSTQQAAVIMPFRDRGLDPLRRDNYRRCLRSWNSEFYTRVVDDGLLGEAMFNRHAAYNAGRRLLREAFDVIVFAESDMVIDLDQVRQAIEMARDQTGMVVPFTEYHYLSPEDSDLVRRHIKDPQECEPAELMTEGLSIGAINVVSLATLDLVGSWDECFTGNWYDDNAMRIAFEVCAGPLRWVEGPAHHLYHLPGHKGDHLTDADKAATAANKDRLQLYQEATTPERIRELTAGVDA